MTRHSYVDATTKRYQKWRAECVLAGDYDPPRLADIERWLRDREDYRDTLGALRNLCEGLREADDAKQVQQVASALISALDDERSFARKAEEFFSAAIRRVGVDADEVRMYDESFRAVGTLHDLQLHKEKADAKVPTD